MLALMFYSFLIGLFAVVYRYILSEQPVLSWWFMWGARFENKWYWKPIWGCELCIAGQMALWSYLITSIAGDLLDHGQYWAYWAFYLFPWNMYVLFGGNLFNMALFIALSIGWAFIIYKGFLKIKQ